MVEDFFIVVVDFLSISVPLADKPYLTMVPSEERSSWAEEDIIFQAWFCLYFDITVLSWTQYLGPNDL